MTRAQFLNDLYHYLRPLGQEQAEQHLTYYAEMLADRMEEYSILLGLLLIASIQFYSEGGKI